MFCEKCGTENRDGTEVCTRCGEKMPPGTGCGGFADILSYEAKPAAAASKPSSGDSKEAMAAVTLANEDIRKLSDKLDKLAAHMRKISKKATIALSVGMTALVAALAVGAMAMYQADKHLADAEEKLTAFVKLEEYEAQIKALGDKNKALEERIAELEPQGQSAPELLAPDTEFDSEGVKTAIEEAVGALTTQQ